MIIKARNHGKVLDMKAEMKRIGEEVRDSVQNILKIAIHAKEHKFEKTCRICMDYINICGSIADTTKKLEN